MLFSSRLAPAGTSRHHSSKKLVGTLLYSARHDNLDKSSMSWSHGSKELAQHLEFRSKIANTVVAQHACYCLLCTHKHVKHS